MKVSIITINYNNASGLRRTLDSVAKQTWNDFELVLVDGGSKDDSCAAIQQYVASHNNVSWISEPDGGIYNAMNKGVRMASGDYCIFMNSGDCFFDEKVMEQCSGYLDGKTDVVSGGVVTDRFSKEAPSGGKLSLTYFIKDSMNHQSTFIKRQLLVEHPYNEQRKIVADSEFFFEILILGNASYQDIPIYVSYCEAAGESGDLYRSIEERMLAIKGLLPPRMVYDVDFIRKYHNPIMMGLGNLLYRRWLRTLYFKYNQIRKRMTR